MHALAPAAALTAVLTGLALSTAAAVAAPTAMRTQSQAAATPTATAPTAERIFGANRIETAIAISKHAFPQPFTTGGSVYVARKDVFADAVAAGTLTDGPILLAPSCGTAPSSVIAEVARLGPARVVGLGGTTALCDSMLRTVAGGRPTARLAGADRYATSVRIAQERVAQGGVSEVYLANGQDSPDPVVGGQLTRGPILLTSSRGLPEVVRRFIHDGPRRIVVLGGEQVVPQEQADEFAVGYSVARIAGDTRTVTAAGIALKQFPADADTVYLARGDVFADAVASGSLTDGPVLLVGSCSLPDAARERIALARPTRVIALGGPSAVCDAVLDQATTATSLAGGRIEPMHRDATGTPTGVVSYGAATTADGRFVVWSGQRPSPAGPSEKGLWLRDQQSGTESRVDVPPGGVDLSGWISSPSISDDAGYIAFRIPQVDPATGTSYSQIMLHDVARGVTTRLTNAPGGGLSTGTSNFPRISGDGSTVVFMSSAADLVHGDDNGVTDVFAVDVATGKVSLLSHRITDPSVLGNGASEFPVVSRDGSVVAFHTRATNLAPDLGASSVLVVDRDAGTVRNLAVDADGTPVNPPLQLLSITDDGRQVGMIFATPTGQQLYRVDRTTGVKTLVSRDATGNAVSAGDGQISRDGEAAVFRSGYRLLRRDLRTGAVQWLGAGFALQPHNQPSPLALDASGARVVVKTSYMWPFSHRYTNFPDSLQTWTLLTSS